MVRSHLLGPGDLEAGVVSLVLLLQGDNVRYLGRIDGVEPRVVHLHLEELLRSRARLAEALRPTLLADECVLVGIADKRDAYVPAW